MRLTAVELRRVSLPLVAPFRTSFGTQTDRDALLVRVLTPDGEGWGECVAMSEPTYSAEYVDGAQDVLRKHLLPLLFALHPEALTAEAVAPTLAAVKVHKMAKAAIEMAVLDAELRTAHESLAERLGAVKDAVDAGVSIGIATSIDDLLETVGAYLDEGYRRVKLKIEPGWDIGPVRAVRERFGDDLLLQVDANTAYTLADADQLAQLDPFDLLLIEQPLREDNIGDHAKLAQRMKTPICLDESITSTRVAIEAIAMGACAIINIKPGRVGGYLEARRIHDACAALGVPVWCGGMLESGIGRAANVALAALPNFTLPGDTSASSRYFPADLTEPFELSPGGVMMLPGGTGIGVAPNPDRLTACTIRREVVRP